MHDDLVLGKVAREIGTGDSENRIPRTQCMVIIKGLWGRRLCQFGLDKAGGKRTRDFVFQRIVQ